MKKNLLLSLVLISFLSFSCKKEETELPPATQTGANTFGARVDGNLWVPSGFGIMPTADILEARMLPNNDLYINARNFSSSPTEYEFEIFLKGVTTTGVYELNTNLTAPDPAANYAYYVHRRVNPINEWITSSQYAGTVTITRIDTVNRIVSGLFGFRAINLYNSPQPIIVSEGRFDIRIL